MATILVTGGAGFIGSTLCDKLLDLGHRVICADDFNSYYNVSQKEDNIKEAQKNTNFSIAKVDICNKEELESLFANENIDFIIHLAARAGVRASFENPELYAEVNVDGTRNLLDLAVSNSVNGFIFGSSSSVYGTNEKVPFEETDPIDNTISPYAQTKKDAEALCEEYRGKIPITIVRFFTVYGPRGRPDMAPYKFTKNIMNSIPIEMYGDGSSIRDYTYVDDIVDGIIKAYEKNFEFEVFNLGNSKTVKLKDLIETIEVKTNKKAVIKTLPNQKGDVPKTFADISKAKKLLGYDPKTTIDEGIEKFVHWFNSNAAS